MLHIIMCVLFSNFRMMHGSIVAVLWNIWRGVWLASFPGLPHLQLLIASLRFCILEAIKYWRCGKPGNEASVWCDTSMLARLSQPAVILGASASLEIGRWMMWRNSAAFFW